MIGGLLTSCLKEETPKEKRLHEGQIVAIPMGIDYRHHVFFNLYENKIVETKSKDVWDIAFESGASGQHVITNTSKYMFVYETDKTNLSEVVSKYGYTQNPSYDHPSGNLDQTGIGDWEDGFVRILDLGTAADGTKHGWYKLKVISVSATTYKIEFAKLEDTNSTTVEITKSNDCSFTYFSLRENKVIDFAPPKGEWDIEFTQFMVHLTEPLVMDYLVTGCLTNRYQTTSALVTEIEFEDIDLAYATSIMMSSEINTIGYDWKDVGLDNVMGGGTANYVVYPDKSYVVRDQAGRYFKIKFLSFFSENGEKGTPTFEYELLN